MKTFRIQIRAIQKKSSNRFNRTWRQTQVFACPFVKTGNSVCSLWSRIERWNRISSLSFEIRVRCSAARKQNAKVLIQLRSSVQETNHQCSHAKWTFCQRSKSHWVYTGSYLNCKCLFRCPCRGMTPDHTGCNVFLQSNVHQRSGQIPREQSASFMTIETLTKATGGNKSVIEHFRVTCRLSFDGFCGWPFHCGHVHKVSFSSSVSAVFYSVPLFGINWQEIVECNGRAEE